MTDPNGHLPDIALETLLRMLPAGKLELAFLKIFGDEWQIFSHTGLLLLGTLSDESPTKIVTPLHVNFNVVGSLEVSNASTPLANAAATWLELLLGGAFNYRLATDLYPALIQARYEVINHVSNAQNKNQVEIMRLEQYQQYQIEKMQAMGSLAAGMAHEINNPAGFVKSNLGTAAHYVKQISKVLNAFHSGDMKTAEAAWKKEEIDRVLEEFPDLLTESVTGVTRISNVASSLDSYARIKYNSVEAIDVNRCVRSMASIIHDKTNGSIALKLNLADDLPCLMADESRINQMLLLMLMNSVTAIGQEGEIEIATTVTDHQISISIRDNGCGIAPENLSRIFDPFFTTQAVGKGMGLGLTISRDVAAAHGGRIEVDSTLKKGSVFRVCLPIANGLTLSPALTHIN